MKNIKNYIYMLAMVLCFSACEDKIDLDLNYTGQKTVIDGRITSETDSSFVKLSYTAPYNSNQKPPAITNAVVEVTRNNEPAVIFTHTANGIYKPVAGYKGIKDANYTLKVLIDGKEYSAQSYMYPMFDVKDTLIQEFKNASGFIQEGYTITYFGNYNQLPIKYYWFKAGKNDTINGDIVFDNRDILFNQFTPFEVPFLRAQKGDSVTLLFQTVDVNVRNYLNALSSLSSGAPAIFRAPPSNPPTNIKGDALGFFYAADVVRRWRIIN